MFLVGEIFFGIVDNNGGEDDDDDDAGCRIGDGGSGTVCESLLLIGKCCDNDDREPGSMLVAPIFNPIASSSFACDFKRDAVRDETLDGGRLAFVADEENNGEDNMDDRGRPLVFVTEEAEGTDDVEELDARMKEDNGMGE